MARCSRFRQSFSVSCSALSSSKSQSKLAIFWVSRRARRDVRVPFVPVALERPVRTSGPRQMARVEERVGDAVRGRRVLEERGVADQRPAVAGARADMPGRPGKPAQPLGRSRAAMLSASSGSNPPRIARMPPAGRRRSAPCSPRDGRTAKTQCRPSLVGMAPADDAVSEVPAVALVRDAGEVAVDRRRRGAAT